MNQDAIVRTIESGNTALGIEFGSTRIKAVLTDRGNGNLPLATGVHDWENRLENDIWTYSTDAIWKGLVDCYQSLVADVQTKYGVTLTTVGVIGISGMMHGYMPFDENGELLVPFRTWRNTMTEEAAQTLSETFSFNIPQRWSVAHLYQACCKEEAHVPKIAYLTTLAGYVHWKLTGEKVVGVGEASGMFPIDSKTGDYDARLMKQFTELLEEKNYPWKPLEIFPKVLLAGASAGQLTEEGAKLLDPSGQLSAQIPFCPPEGDAGTGMVATNSVAIRTGNVSAGTSVFAMVVLDKPLTHFYPEIDMVTTPDGSQVAMVHCNNGTSDLSAWVNLFDEFAVALTGGQTYSKDEIYGLLYRTALSAQEDCGGLLAYNYASGEPITGLDAGRPLFVRKPDATFNLANFMRSHLYASLATLKIGLDILWKKEDVQVDSVTGHGGFFKTPVVGQKILAAAMNAPITVMETAGEGGPWGMAILAAYAMDKGATASLSEYLQECVFTGETGSTIAADASMVEGFEAYIESFQKCLSAEIAAVKNW
ncbi:MAG: FGGY-family carbohydrate kinase [Clostridium sp.]|jgi:sugar (pentulose or hexulose) kinase|nr:FGGY-family carbohydrate kinase [Clostridium sp.]